jgi:hypothetical protein
VPFRFGSEKLLKVVQLDSFECYFYEVDEL